MPEFALNNSVYVVISSPFVGSFLGVLVHRLPAGQPVVFSRSACPHCSHRLSARDIVPFFSWLLLRGQCRFCAHALGAFYPSIELAATGAAVWAASIMSGWLLWPTCVLAWVLLTLAIIDWQRFLLPDILTLLLVPGGLLVAALIDPALVGGHAIGAVAGFLFFALVAWLYHRLRGYAGLGGGDAKLLAAAGAWVSWTGLPSVILIAALAALTVQLTRAVLGQGLGLDTRVPFGSYLALGTWLVWLYGPLELG